MTSPLPPSSDAYRRPDCQVGDRLRCEVRGLVKVAGFSEALVPWPYATTPKGSRRRLILCGDLVRAVRQESPIVVSRFFGVSDHIVGRWRRALGVDSPKKHKGRKK
jgi:hypothetical protein